MRTRSRTMAIVDREKKRLAAAIRALRTERGWTLEIAAERIGITAGHLGRLERGKQSPTVDTLVGLSVAYGVSLRDLFC